MLLCYCGTAASATPCAARCQPLRHVPPGVPQHHWAAPQAGAQSTFDGSEGGSQAPTWPPPG